MPTSKRKTSKRQSRRKPGKRRRSTSKRKPAKKRRSTSKRKPRQRSTSKRKPRRRTRSRSRRRPQSRTVYVLGPYRAPVSTGAPTVTKLDVCGDKGYYSCQSSPMCNWYGGQHSGRCM